MTKISRLILSAFCLLTFTVNTFAYTPISRVRNFVNDAANNVPITASYMDAELNQLVTAFNATMVVQATSPSSPFEGMTWYNTTLHLVEEYRNNEWITIGALHISATQMANPQSGDLWYNTTTHVMQLYNGSSFVSLTSNTFANNVGIGTTLPLGGLDVENVGMSTTAPTIFYGFGAGNVGIGTIFPGELLDIEGGNVGIGTVTTGYKLNVVGTIAATSYTGQAGKGILGVMNTSSYGVNTAYGPTTSDINVGGFNSSCGASNVFTCEMGPSSPSQGITSTGGSSGINIQGGCFMTVPKSYYWEIAENCGGSNTVTAVPSGS